MLNTRVLNESHVIFWEKGQVWFHTTPTEPSLQIIYVAITIQWKCLNCKVNQNLKLIAQNLKLIVLSDRTMYINKYSEANTWASLS